MDGLRSNLLEFIQESMSEIVLESISSEGVEFEGVKEMYSWVSYIDEEDEGSVRHRDDWSRFSSVVSVYVNWDLNTDVMDESS